LNLKYFQHHVQNVTYRWRDCAPEVGTLYTPALGALLGAVRQPQETLDQRHKDLARSVQNIYEEAFFGLLNHIYEKYSRQNLALPGGCALYSVANGKIYYRTPFRRVFVPPAAGDAGGAIGAALVVWQKFRTSDTGQSAAAAANPTVPTRPAELKPGSWLCIPDSQHAYTGAKVSDGAIASLFRRRGLAPALHGCPNQKHALLFDAPGATTDFSGKDYVIRRYFDSRELCRRAAQAIAASRVVGCFQ